ncbi:hypothetical protein CVT25_014454 [Psilocybe cyanescens]|uniref:AB hydrolase-1 domain-containing protein n=1 Tax=Psilocybe cyanescens TaxID=93625 RepID=A0A409XR99_PSICY|nr:hypothetical protein CVT25_014454 [Psilocybe cyanescens]
MAFEKIKVNDSGVELAYTDSGPVAGSSSYSTIVVIHGLCFSSNIFKRVQAIAANKGVRFIAVSRRNYPGSTAFTSEELEVMTNGSPAKRDEWMKERGHEYGMLIDGLIQKYDLPSVSADGKTGGVILYGWSLGSGEANATIAHADTLPAPVRARLGSYIRSLILHEGPPLVFGLPMPEKDWAPFHVDSVPPELRFPFFAQWVTGYFDHEDLSKRDLNTLSYILPSSARPGTIYNITKEEFGSIVFTGKEIAMEGPYMLGFGSQLNAAYRKALFDASYTGELFPKVVVSVLAGDQAPAFGIAALWAIQDEARKQGVDSIKFEMSVGANHFVSISLMSYVFAELEGGFLKIHWDEPERALDLYLDLASPV